MGALDSRMVYEAERRWYVDRDGGGGRTHAAEGTGSISTARRTELR